MTTEWSEPPDGLGQRLIAAWLRASVRWLVRPSLNPRVPVSLQRRWGALLAKANSVPSEVTYERVDLGGVAADRAQPGSATGTSALLYLHGGGYILNKPRVQASIFTRIAVGLGATAYAPDYRLAPEHPFPAALDDCRSAYEGLLDHGADPGRTAFVGDSAGGGLVLATAVAARDAGRPMPAALVLLSPWVDLTLGGESIETKARDDAMLNRPWLSECVRLYLDGAAPDDPAASPLFADLAGLPPTLIQVGTREMLLSDSERLAKRLAAADVDVELKRYDGLGHVFQVHAGTLRISDEAISELAAFLDERW